MTEVVQSGSSSVDQPGHWWYRARNDLLRAALGDFLGTPRRLLDVGSADGPSVSWNRLLNTVERVGLEVRRSTYGFGGVFPMLAAERLVRRRRPHGSGTERELAHVPRVLERGLMSLCSAEARVLRRRDVPFGSSVLLATEKPALCRKSAGADLRSRRAWAKADSAAHTDTDATDMFRRPIRSRWVANFETQRDQIAR